MRHREIRHDPQQADLFGCTDLVVPRTIDNTDAAFADFWRAYPRRVAKGAARKAFAKAIKNGVEPAAIIEAARRYAAERAGEEARFTKHPSTWLNGECWDDEPVANGGRRPRSYVELLMERLTT